MHNNYIRIFYFVGKHIFIQLSKLATHLAKLRQECLLVSQLPNTKFLQVILCDVLQMLSHHFVLLEAADMFLQSNVLQPLADVTH